LIIAGKWHYFLYYNLNCAIVRICCIFAKEGFPLSVLNRSHWQVRNSLRPWRLEQSGRFKKTKPKRKERKGNYAFPTGVADETNAE